MIKILIADDHPIVRKGLKQILAETPNIIVAGEANNGAEVLTKVLKNEYDMVLLDISMPGRDGIDTLKELKDLKPNLPVLVLSIHPEDQYAVRVLRAGAYGYLTKESAAEELISAIRTVSLGRKYISPSVAEKLVFNLNNNAPKQPHEKLSDREYQVMDLIASGKTVKEISEDLSLSVKTISTYRARILEKMKMKNIAELIRYAIKNGLVM
jgi:two-component system invasion response regulator UvrY